MEHHDINSSWKKKQVYQFSYHVMRIGNYLYMDLASQSHIKLQLLHKQCFTVVQSNLVAMAPIRWLVEISRRSGRLVEPSRLYSRPIMLGPIWYVYYTLHYIVYIKHEHRNDGQLVTHLWDLGDSGSEAHAFVHIYLKPNGPNASPAAQPQLTRPITANLIVFLPSRTTNRG